MGTSPYIAIKIPKSTFYRSATARYPNIQEGDGGPYHMLLPFPAPPRVKFDNPSNAPYPPANEPKETT